ncbi:MAG: hypothetical protein HIU85_11225 [Proteobacteria bacterium]|nr:hypothetical protein [Pseudomonadota bacterium]
MLRFLHWLAWARANDGAVEVLNLAFWDWAKYFSIWRERPGCLFPARQTRADQYARMLNMLPERVRKLSEDRWWLQRMMQSAAGKWPRWHAIKINDRAGERIDLQDPQFLEEVRHYRLSACAGWCIAGWQYVEEQQHTLRSWFQPAAEWQTRAEDYIGSLRAKHDVVVGLLARQTDYRIWNDGRFYFSTAQYARWIRQLVDLRVGRNIVVVLASEAWQDPKELCGLPYAFAPGAKNLKGHWFDSFAALSLCDFVISPPSTFSATAAFIGHIPVLPLTRGEQDLNAADMLHNALIDAARHPEFSIAVK